MYYLRVYKTLLSTGRFHWLMKLVGGDRIFATIDEDDKVEEETYRLAWYGLAVLHIFEYVCGYLPVKISKDHIELTYVNYKKILYPLHAIVIWGMICCLVL